MRASALLLATLALPGCAERDLWPVERLDPQTAVNITIMADPWVYGHDVPMLAANARDYLNVGVVETNRAGKRDYWLGVVAWSTIDRSALPVPVPLVKPGKLRLGWSGQSLDLLPAAGGLAEVGTEKSIFAGPQGVHEDAWYALTARTTVRPGEIAARNGRARPGRRCRDRARTVAGRSARDGPVRRSDGIHTRRSLSGTRCSFPPRRPRPRGFHMLTFPGCCPEVLPMRPVANRAGAAIVLMTLAATAFAHETHPADGSSQGELLFFTSAEVFAIDSDDPAFDTSDLDLAVDVIGSWSAGRFRAFGEVLLSNEEQDIERFQVGWEARPDTYIWLGRFHQPASVWNTSHHHGRYLQPSITRPAIELWEDEDGVLPQHFLGVLAETRLPLQGAGGLSLAGRLWCRAGDGGTELVPVDDLRT